MNVRVCAVLILVVLGLSSVAPMQSQALSTSDIRAPGLAAQPPPPTIEHILTFESVDVGYRFGPGRQPYESIGVIIPETGVLGIVGIPEVIGAYASPGTRHALRNSVESEFGSDGEYLEIELVGYTSSRVTVHVGRDFVSGTTIQAELTGFFRAGDSFEPVDSATATIPNAITAPTIPLTIESATGAINYLRISYGHAQEPEIVDDITIQVWDGDPPNPGATPDVTAPTVSISTPVNGSETSEVTVSGYVDEARGWNRRVTITTPAGSWNVLASGPYIEDSAYRYYFGALVRFLSGANTVRVTATDTAGNTGSDTVTVNYTPPVYPPPPPEWPDTLDIRVRLPDCYEDCGMEVTQAIQGWEQIGPTPYRNNNEVHLVAGKRTLVRVYAELLGIDTPVDGVAATIRGYRSGVELPGSPIYAYNRVTLVPGETYLDQRPYPDKSFNFFLPPAWTEEGTTRLQATVNYGQNPPEGPHKFDVYNSTTYDVDFKESEGFCVHLSRFHSHREGDVTPTWGEVFSNLEVTRQIYPVSPDRLDIRLGNTYRVDRYLDTGDNTADDWNLFRLSNDFRRALGLYYGLAYVACANDVWVGLTDHTVEHRGITTPFRPVSVSVAETDPADFFTMKTAHEIGHSQGMGHVRGSCQGGEAPILPFEDYPSYSDAITGRSYFSQSIGDWGVKLAGSTFTTRSPSTNGAMMSYCYDSWMSVYTWNWLYGHFTDGERGEAYTESALASNAAPSAPYLIIGGAIDGTHGLLSPAWTEMLAAGSSDQVGTGPYTLQLLSSTGAVLFTRNFAGEPLQDLEAYATFREVVPAKTGTTAIRLSGGAITTPVTLSAGTNKPYITLGSPNGGEKWDGAGSREVYWTAGDLDGDPLTFTVFYSADNGTSWRVIASDLKQRGMQVMLDELPGCTNTCLVRVAVSDGINSSTDTSAAPFSKAGQAPVVSIASPKPVAAFAYGEPVIFDAMVADWDEASVPAANLIWTSSLNGLLGSGYTISKNRLSPGLHTITLNVTDSSGMRTRGTTAVYIGPTNLVFMPAIKR